MKMMVSISMNICEFRIKDHKKLSLVRKHGLTDANRKRKKRLVIEKVQKILYYERSRLVRNNSVKIKREEERKGEEKKLVNAIKDNAKMFNKLNVKAALLPRRLVMEEFQKDGKKLVQ